MQKCEVSGTAYAVPLASPAYPAVGELWDFPEEGAQHCAPSQIAAGPTGRLHEQIDFAAARASLAEPKLDFTLGLGKAGQDYLA